MVLQRTRLLIEEVAPCRCEANYSSSRATASQTTVSVTIRNELRAVCRRVPGGNRSTGSASISEACRFEYVIPVKNPFAGPPLLLAEIEAVCRLPIATQLNTPGNSIAVQLVVGCHLLVTLADVNDEFQRE